MTQQIIIPELDPIPLPAPYWLLKFLLILTFILHIIAMNFALGGGIIAGITDLIGRKKNSQFHLNLARSFSKMLPITTAFTITLGIAPLLFIQVLYGQYFYTASITLAWPWLSVILLLLIGYYGYYIYQFNFEKLQGVRAWIVLGSAVLFALIGLIYTNTLVLMLTPEKWAQKYFANPHGTNFNFDDPTVIPRYLHFLVASVSVAGLLVLIYGLIKLKSDVDFGRWAIKYGGLWFVIGTVLQYAVGIWFLLALKKDLMMVFMGGDGLATAIFGISVLLSLVSLILILLSFNAQNPKPLSISGLALLFLTIVGMSVMRDILRDAYLKDYFKPEQFEVQPQISVLIVFGIVFIAGLITVGYMLNKVLKAKPVSA
ncbi:hypothetical protein [Candidatus Kryptobacter tengchongensis]|uniref:hypothetical protein n=1 Tax=Kryptobacter tengchongensis TaxID=1643429 RepID=UPI000707EF71|nr:hypothetical protein [Candidatus Kryptobacter tengchongensis]CUS87069.1 hypothetical protein JGI20_01095 [Candidatus Kryptobacter tengchongensis]